SRRRHTRSKRDWSSDVCSSDLFLRLGIVEGCGDCNVSLGWLVVCLDPMLVHGLATIIPQNPTRLVEPVVLSAMDGVVHYVIQQRSEERRVGKECRDRRARYRER